MTEQIVPMQVDGVDLLVATVVVPGSEPTSGRLDRAGRRVVEGFDRAQEAISAVAVRLAGSVKQLEERAVRPDRLQVEFGLSFTAEGGILVAGSSVAASLKVTISYDRPSQASSAAAPVR
jgi:Trypsin-co-occurring domain 1